ncbi:MAG TPA: tetratricopeptide repeat protein, partial [Blastocatellia bacterium]
LRRYLNNVQSIPTQSPRIEIMQRPSWWRLFLRPAWQSAFAVFLMLGIGLGLWRVYFAQSLADKGRASLQAALRESPLEARIGGFNWPPQRITLGSQPDNVADKTSLESAQIYLHEAVNAQPSPDSYYALGQFYLAKGELDSAIEQFDRALEGAPKNARLHNDLGAALMEKAKVSQENDSEGSLEEFNRSVEHLNQARALDDSLLEALFNLALCHQYMGIPFLAEVEWQAYLKQDSNSRWADEARRHLKDLEDKKERNSQAKEGLLQGFLAAWRTNDGGTAWKVLSGNREVITGRLIWWQLLDDFFELTAGGHPHEASERLRALRYVGSLELNLGDEAKKANGDPYISELERFYRKSSSGARADLENAHKYINEGNKLFDVPNYDGAFSQYNSARKILERVGDVWEVLLTDYLIGNCHIRKGNMKQSLPVFNQLVTECRKKGYLWLLGQSLYSLAMVQDSQMEHSKAIENTEETLRISEEINDPYNIQRSLCLIGDQYRKLANYKSASIYLNRCMKQMNVSWPGTRQMWRNCDQLTQMFLAKHLYAAAADYSDEALRLSQEMGNQAFIYVSYAHLALLRGKQQNYPEALKLAQLGLEAAPVTGDARAYASIQMGHLHRQAGDFRQALYDYDQSIKYIDLIEESASHDVNNQAEEQKRNRLPALRYDAHKGRLFCLLADGGDVAAVEQELKTTLSLLEAHRDKI